jgi:hypothetical protein
VDTVESLALEIEELKGELSRVREFLNEQSDAYPCEHCGQIMFRKHMLAPYGVDKGSDGKPLLNRPAGSAATAFMRAS